MIQLHPSENFSLVYQIADPTDASTYYVRSVIRDSVKGSIIETINLTDNGGGRFSKTWQVPADPSGQGRFIDITITVYTDSGHTTKSPNYEEQNVQYLIAFRINPYRFGGGGGSVSATIDYVKIAEALRNIVREEITKIPVADVIDFNPVVAEIRNIKIPDQYDPTKLIEKIEQVKTTIEKIKQPVSPVKDIKMIVDGVGVVAKMTNENRKVIAENHQQALRYIVDMQKFLEGLTKRLIEVGAISKEEEDRKTFETYKKRGMSMFKPGKMSDADRRLLKQIGVGAI